MTRSMLIVHLSFLAGGSTSSSSDVSISITSSADRWEALIGLEDFDVISDVTVLVQAPLLPSDCLIFPSHRLMLVIVDNASSPMF